MEISDDGQRLLLTLALSALVLSLSLIKLTQNRKHRIMYKNLPPGPCGIPVIGESISFVRALTRNKPVEWFGDRIDRHGPVFKTSLMGTKTVVVTGREGNRFVFSGSSDGALTLNQPESVAKIFGKHGMFEMTGHKHRLVRADVAGFLKPESIQRYLGQIESVVRDKLNKELDGKDSICVVPLMKNVTFNVISNIFFGLPDGEARDELLREFTTTVKGLWSLPLDFPGTVFHKALKARQKLCEKLLKIMEIRKRQIEEGVSNNDVVTTLLLLKDENGGPLSPVEVLDTLFGLIIASHDTVTIVLSQCVRLLATDSEVYQKVFEEHREVYDAKRNRSNGDDEGKLIWSDIQTLKYSWRVAQELMRLDPPLLGNFRRVIKDTKFDSYDIPKGWQVFWVSSGTHLDNKIFEDPLRFDPSRFKSTSKTYPPYTYIPFGAGPRICPGAEFARVEIVLVIHYMVTKYRWTLMIPDEPITRQPAPLPAMGLPVFIHPINDI